MDEKYLYNSIKRPWHSPIKILNAGIKLYDIFGEAIDNRGEFQRVREGKAVAIMLLGFYLKDNQNSKNKQYMQYYDEGSSPDYVTMYPTEVPNKPIEGVFFEVEVVEFGKHSETDFVNFLTTKKLSALESKKGYDEKTHILCDVSKTTLVPPAHQINEELKKINPKSKVLYVGRTSPDKPVYSLVSVWPEVGSQENIDLEALSRTYPGPHNVRFKKSSKRFLDFERSNEPTINEFEIFGLDESYLRKKY